jgi:hypothetical protein
MGTAAAVVVGGVLAGGIVIVLPDLNRYLRIRSM